ncbi:MAG: cytochrome c peroxidase [Bacteroidota bacterium]
MNRLKYMGGIALLLIVISCDREDPMIQSLREPFIPEVPAHVERPTIPESNPLTQAKVNLGKKLFFDPILSKDFSVSCASCHDPSAGFSDVRRVSLGVEGKSGFLPEERRNAMALMNLTNQRFLFWDGAVSAEDGAYDELEIQALKPILNDFEMDNTLEEVNRRLKESEEYVDLFDIAFEDTVKDIYIARALASFERTLLSYGSKYDLYFERGLDSTVFTDQEWRGFKVYFDEKEGVDHAECFHCHGGPELNDLSQIFRNNGLPITPANPNFDPGTSQVPGLTGFGVAFKVPTLRNISFTAPYMHDGRFASLDEVLDFYQKGVDKNGPDTDRLMRTVGFSDEEKEDLKAFLLTFNDTAFINNPNLRPD